MKDDSHRLPEPGIALEARITAWVLGEVSPFEASELERLCSENPELKEFESRTRRLHGALLRVNEDGGDWKLPEAKRRKIEALFDREVADHKVVALPGARNTGRRMLLATAACAMIGSGFWWLLDRPVPLMAERSVSYPRYSAAVPMEPSPATAVEPPLDPAAGITVRSRSLNDPQPAAAPSSEIAEHLRGEIDVLEASDSDSSLAMGLGGLRRGNVEIHAGEFEGYLNEAREQSGLLAGEAPAFLRSAAAGQRGPGERPGAASLPYRGQDPGVFGRGWSGTEDQQTSHDDSAAIAFFPEEDSVSAKRSVVPRTSKFDQVDRFDGSSEAAEPQVALKVQKSARERSDARLKKLEGDPKVDALEVETAAEAFSTFSLNVSDASFRLAAAALERGEIPDPAAIRPEEFYNAFDYGDPAPGGSEPVACTIVQAAHPVIPHRNLLRIGIRTASEGRGASKPLNLTLLVDGSGSMEREDRRAGVKLAVSRLAELLKEGDVVSVVSFSRQPRLLADRLPGVKASELPGLIARTPSEGGTNLEEGLRLAGEIAVRQYQEGASNRIVLFTDGAANLGDADPASLENRIRDLRLRGIAFDAAGFGAEGLNDHLLERLARHGDGRYHVIDHPEDADAGFAAKLAGAFRPAAENVKVQVRFNPARVARFRLIGFDQHRLAREDFHNDAVEAAELAAAEAGNALYQIEVLPDGDGEIGEVSVRFRNAADGAMVERSWTILHEPKVPVFDRADPSIQLAGLAAFAAAKLRGEPMADAVDFQQLAPVLGGVKSRYPSNRKVAELEAMIGKLR